MATSTINEKTEPSPRELPIDTTTNIARLSDKHSNETLHSQSLALSPEKSTDCPRTSDVSVPSTAHQANPFDADIEAIMSPSSERCLRKSTNLTRGDCPVWPGQDHWKQRAKVAKMNRSCKCLAHLSKRNRLIVKILIGFLIVGIAVGIGVGISKPLGAGIWQPHNNQN